MNKDQDWRLLVDDEEVWRGKARPDRATVLSVVRRIESLGWNGTQLDLFHGGAWVCWVTPGVDT